MPASYTPAQKAAIAEFSAITNIDKNAAVKALKLHDWNLNAATNAFFSEAGVAGYAALRGALGKIFDSYRDNPQEEPDEIGPEGTSNMLGEMEIALDDIGALIFSELAQSPSLGRLTREGFVDGCAAAGADSLPKVRAAVASRRTAIAADKPLFRRVYNHTFALALQPGQKSLPPELAAEFWRTLLAPPGLAWRSPRTPWLDWWLQFVADRWRRAVNKDLWRQTLAFADETLRDESLSFWSEDSSWPSVIDEFVEWVKTEKRPGDAGAGAGHVDAMDVE